MAQGEPLPPTIFNVVMDAVIRHWVTVAMPPEAGTGGLGLTTIDLVAYFYAKKWNPGVSTTGEDTDGV